MAELTYGAALDYLDTKPALREKLGTSMNAPHIWEFMKVLEAVWQEGFEAGDAKGRKDASDERYTDGLNAARAEDAEELARQLANFDKWHEVPVTFENVAKILMDVKAFHDFLRRYVEKNRDPA
jgi:hypothetical protein